MAYLFQPEYIRYACTCGSLKTISKMYFCRHCLKVRCGYCVCHEADSHYCSNCLETIAVAEARLKKYRCENCFQCPSCFHPLSVRATTVSRTADDGAKTAIKMYYLACFFCRWTSRDVNIPDQTVATGSWPLRENPHATRLHALMDHYRVVALREKFDKEKRHFQIPRRPYIHLGDKFGLTAMMARKRAGMSSLAGNPGLDPGNPPEIAPAVASDELEPLPPSVFTETPDLTKVTTLRQRLAHPEVQAETRSELWPVHCPLSIKRSQRCRACDHNVCKQEYNPGSIKFKIQLAAYYHIPELRILSLEPLQSGASSELILRLTNPTQHLTSVELRPLPTPEQEELELEREKTMREEVRKAEKKDTEKGVGNREGLTLPCLARQVSLYEPARRVDVTPNARLELPTAGVVLPPRDDAAEYDDSGETHSFNDDPKVVVWRKGNKAAVRVHVTPNCDLIAGTKVLCGFTLGYGYVNTMATLEQREPQRVELSIPVYIKPGAVVDEKMINDVHQEK